MRNSCVAPPECTLNDLFQWVSACRMTKAAFLKAIWIGYQISNKYTVPHKRITAGVWGNSVVGFIRLPCRLA